MIFVNFHDKNEIFLELSDRFGVDIIKTFQNPFQVH